MEEIWRTRRRTLVHLCAWKQIVGYAAELAEPSQDKKSVSVSSGIFLGVSTASVVLGWNFAADEPICGAKAVSLKIGKGVGAAASSCAAAKGASV